ncbi:MAG TPA: winged helix-turn-helix domain-containing protein [Nitrososphaeraceae archaeon]|nr:winged helix-turn-helix domain-containing protein [Nitrososphaeraceae archaeon]
MSSSGPLRNELNNILNIIAELSENNTETDVFDHAIIKRANLPPTEVNKYLNELRSLDLITEVSSRPSGISFSLYRITTEGLNKLENLDLR